jgi:hypothetical protein
MNHRGTKITERNTEEFLNLALSGMCPFRFGQTMSSHPRKVFFFSVLNSVHSVSLWFRYSSIP